MKHKKQAIAALEKDCEITGEFAVLQPDGTYQFCATGCLGVSAGLTPEEVLREDTEDILDRIADYYDISRGDLDEIIILNDSVPMQEPDHIQKRRDKVVSFVKTIWEE